VILNDLREKLHALADRLTQLTLDSEAVDILQSPEVMGDPARALAEALCTMMGEKILQKYYVAFLESALMMNRPHGLGRKRRISRTLASGKRKMMEARSIVFSNTLLESLAHVHLADRGGRLSLQEFLAILSRRYGLYVDEAPSGLAAAREDLVRNRAILEDRLRDLGLLVGVNDAESMKYLRPRYRACPGE
jgi:hypothetical protein